MGRISKGILGGFRGTVGTVVGSSWKGIEYIRSKAGARSGAASNKQLEQRAKFKMVSDFLNTIAALVKISFAGFAVNQTGRNHALAYMLSNAITGNYPDNMIDYSQVLVARGSKLPNAGSPSAASTNPGVIAFSWLDNSGLGEALATDRAILVAHCPELNQSVFTLEGPARSALTGSLNVPDFAGKEVHTWISFISADEKQVATSLYTGSMTVTV